MESNYNNRDFEQFVKQNADQYRMFPSEKVWKGVFNALHTRMRWYGIAFGLLLLASGSVTWIMLDSSGKNQSSPDSLTNLQNSQSVNDKKLAEPAILNVSAQSNKRNIPFNPRPYNQQNDFLRFNQAASLSTNDIAGKPIITLQKLILNNTIAARLYNNETVINKPVNLSLTDQLTDDNIPDAGLNSKKAASVTQDNRDEKTDIYPLTIESVVNSFKHISKRRKISWQVFFTPTISYRKLTENKQFLLSTQANNNPYGYTSLPDVNNAVTHKPDMGLNMGFSAGYPLGRNLKIIAGLQFNVSKYDIRAYTNSSEVATIALNTGGGSNSVSTMTKYRNFDGTNPNWLRNLYVSASIPVGAELKLTGHNKNYLGIAGTIQPAYILGDRAYLISTDYKNYAEVPSLIRKWNVYTSFETFAGYSTGKIQWKVGPQVRYQMRSSFQKKYPVKEYLFDFGLKVGIMLNR